MQSTELHRKIQRSLPQLSAQDLQRVAELVEQLSSQRAEQPVVSSRDQWVDHLQQKRDQLATMSQTQTVLELRQEERY